MGVWLWYRWLNLQEFNSLLFVKDKHNLCGFNVWSCGDYNHNLTGFTINNLPNTTVTLSKNYVVNGEYGIKITRNATEGYYTQLKTICTISEEDYCKTFTFSAYVNNQLDNSCNLQLSSGTFKVLAIPKDAEGLFNISLEIPSDINDITCALTFSGDRVGTVYTDNWSITIQ